MSQIGLKVLIFGYLFWYGLGFLNLQAKGIQNLGAVWFVLALFFVIMILGYFLSYNYLTIRPQPGAVPFEAYGVGTRSFVMILMAFSAGFGLFAASRGSGMLGYHSLRALIGLGILVFVYHLLLRGWKRALLLALFAALAVYSLGFYSRRPFLTLLAVVPLIPLIRNRYSFWSTYTRGLVGVIIVLSTILYVTGVRYLSDTVNLLDLTALIQQGIGVLLVGEGFDTVHLTAYVMDTYDSTNFLNGESFFGGFVNFVPRVFWPDKPVAFGVYLSGQYFNVQQDAIFTNFGPGIVAEAYANGGYFAVAITASLLGFLVGFADKKIENERYNWNIVLFGIVLYPALFFLIRGDFLNSFYEFYSKFTVIWLVTASLGLQGRLFGPASRK